MDKLGASWAVRGHLGTDAQPGTRFKYGEERADVRLDTQEVSLIATLAADGSLSVRVARPGAHSSRVILSGKLKLDRGRVVLDSLELVQ